MINRIWRARLIRLWLVIGVPLAFWSAYEAWDSYQKINFWDTQIEYWRVRLTEQESMGRNAGLLDPHKSLMEAMGYRTESVKTANSLTWVAVMLMAMPVVGAVILKVSEWVWAGQPPASNIENGARSSKSWREVLLSKQAKWSLGLGGILVFTGIMYALRPESTTTTVIQVIVQVGVLGIVLALIKFFRR
jgi:hypothetical protein